MGHKPRKATKLKRLERQIFKTSPSKIEKLSQRMTTIENTKGL